MTTSPAFWTAIAAVITAVGGVLAVWKHSNNNTAHSNPSPPATPEK